MRRPAAVAVALLSLLACGGDDDDAAEPTTVTAPTTSATASAEPLPDACDLVADPSSVIGETVPPGVPAGDERRRSCAYSATGSGGIAITIGLEGGSRFDEKAEASANALGDPGEDVEGIGDRARFYFADEEPAALGGLLIEVGDRTIDITLQGLLDREELRSAALALGEAAASSL